MSNLNNETLETNIYEICQRKQLVYEYGLEYWRQHIADLKKNNESEYKRWEGMEIWEERRYKAQIIREKIMGIAKKAFIHSEEEKQQLLQGLLAYTNGDSSKAQALYEEFDAIGHSKDFFVKEPINDVSNDLPHIDNSEVIKNIPKKQGFFAKLFQKKENKVEAEPVIPPEVQLNPDQDAYFMTEIKKYEAMEFAQKIETKKLIKAYIFLTALAVAASFIIITSSATVLQRIIFALIELGWGALSIFGLIKAIEDRTILKVSKETLQKIREDLSKNEKTCLDTTIEDVNTESEVQEQPEGGLGR